MPMNCLSAGHGRLWTEQAKGAVGSEKAQRFTLRKVVDPNYYALAGAYTFLINQGADVPHIHML